MGADTAAAGIDLHREGRHGRSHGSPGPGDGRGSTPEPRTEVYTDAATVPLRDARRSPPRRRAPSGHRLPDPATTRSDCRRARSGRPGSRSLVARREAVRAMAGTGRGEVFAVLVMR